MIYKTWDGGLLVLCFKDRTFCKDEACSCSYPKFTKEEQEAAEYWWNPEGKPELKNQAPICFIIHDDNKRIETRGTN